MVKKAMMAMVVLAFPIGAMAGTTYNFENTIDKWGLLNVDAKRVSGSYTYTHDLSGVVDFAAGDTVTSLNLELDFTNDNSDSVTKVFGAIVNDNREFVIVSIQGGTSTDIGEQDNGSYTLSVDSAYLSADGLLTITLEGYDFGPISSASFWLDHSKLYGTAVTADVPNPEPGPTPAVPAPGALLLTGLGSGLVGFLRRRRAV